MMYYLRQAFRFLSKNKGYTLLSVFGLGLSLTLVVLLGVYLYNENHVDTHHTNAQNIYRVLHNNECAFSPPFGAYLKDNVKALDEYCRTFCLEAVLKTEHNMVQSERCFYVDSNFFSMFSFSLIVGNPKQVLKSRDNIVLTQSYAKVLFGNENPIGKTVTLNNRLEYTVSGIAADFGSNTHFKPVDVILPFGAMDDYMDGSNYLTQFDWRWMLPALYISTNTNNLAEAESQILDDLNEWYWLFKEDQQATLTFQPLDQVYLSKAQYSFANNVRSGNRNVLHLSTFIILAVCVIAFVNFINLSISNANTRFHEICIKRINGANARNFVLALFTEQLLLMGVLLMFFFLALNFFIPLFNQLINFNTSFVAVLSQDFVIKIILAFLLITNLISLVILFFLLNKTQDYQSNTKPKIIGVGLLQKAMLVLQYSLSIALIISMFVILKQKQFIANYDLGFNKTETVLVKLNREFKGQGPVFSNELAKIAGVNNVSLCNGMPGLGIMNLRFEHHGKAKDIDHFHIDDNYFKTMDFIVDIDKPLSNNNCWINASAAKELAYNSEIGTVTIKENNVSRTLTVLGILPDMNFHSLYEKTKATIFTKINTDQFIDYALLNIDPIKAQQVLKEAQKSFASFSSNFPFDYAFLSDKMNSAYAQEEQTLKLITWFSIFGIVLSSLGMLSLSLIIINKKTKEIGIRKVNGASAMELLQMLNVDFVIWVLISFVIASPLAYFTMNTWLQNFAYKTTISWWLFALAGCFALFTALFTISIQTVRAARKNPIEVLRCE